MESQSDILKLVVSSLDAIGVPYMLTGSMALNFYATPRMTRDIDIVIELRAVDVEKLVRTLQTEFYIDKEMIDGALRDGLPFNVIHLASVTKVDFILKKETSFQEIAFNRRKLMDFAGGKIQVISPEDLILSKLSWAKQSLSEVQLRDVKSLFDTVPNLDRAYLESWIDLLNLRDLISRVTK